MKITSFLILTLFLLPILIMAQPATWQARGVGGGGAFYAPSINPANPNELYVSSDMSELYHSLDGGATYDLLSFTQINVRHNSNVRFTNIAGTIVFPTNCKAVVIILPLSKLQMAAQLGVITSHLSIF